MKRFLLAILASAHALAGSVSAAELSSVEKSKTRETRDDTRSSASASSQTSRSKTYAVEGFVFPIISKIEAEGIAFADFELSNCHFTNSNMRTWSHPLEGTVVQMGSVEAGIYSKFNEPPIVMVPIDTQSKTKTGVLVVGEPWPARDAIQCYQIYSGIAQFVVKTISDEIAHKTVEKNGTRTVIIAGSDFERLSETVIERLNYGNADANELLDTLTTWVGEIYKKPAVMCFIPTAAGLISGQSSVRCANYELDQANRIFKRNGITLLSSEMVNGVKWQLTVTDSLSASKEKSNSSSSSTRKDRKQGGTISK